ncbi:unnamed protein product [Rotaria magnacalcarata]|uniref:Uncharacterized protein n=1 Tax=Rotaria magnacalcarata TaxID=392030 RepID=A0A816WWX6_9BILA|nr:unnamed protein product [Rotaria magnacalcarata]CAF5159627.1 unnamed protein product [Rotaria magnacalcarata]
MTNKKLEELTAQALIKLQEHVCDIESLNQWKKQMFYLINEIGEQKLSSAVPMNQHDSSLDPVDWSSARFVAHQMLNSSMHYIQHVRDRPVWQSMPNDVRAAIEDECLPENGQSLSAVCNDVLSYVLPYGRGSVHPRFWGWASGEGTLGGVLADMVSATMNMNAGAYMNSAAFVERTVIEWMRQIFGFPKGTSGGLLQRYQM